MKRVYKALVVDDEPVAREILETHLQKLGQIEITASCKSAAEAFSWLSKEKIDIVFLDINMPEMDGLLFADAIRGKTEVIFTTAYREYAVEGFDLNAVDYLLKPISLDRLMKAVQKFIDGRGDASEVQPNDFTFFRCDRQMKKVQFQDITHVESCGDYIKIHALDETLVTRETMNHVMEKLPSVSFMRVHRSFAVSLSKIDSYTPEHITIGRVAVPISRSYREEVIKKLRDM